MWIVVFLLWTHPEDDYRAQNPGGLVLWFMRDLLRVAGATVKG